MDIPSCSFQSNWVLWPPCDIFGFLWVIGMDKVRERIYRSLGNGLTTLHPVTMQASVVNHEIYKVMQNILPLLAKDLAPPCKAKTSRSIPTSPPNQIFRLFWLANLLKLCLLYLTCCVVFSWWSTSFKQAIKLMALTISCHCICFTELRGTWLVAQNTPEGKGSTFLTKTDAAAQG